VSTLALLVLLLLMLVGLIVGGGLGYLVYRHPTLVVPLTVATTAAVLVAFVVGVAQTTPRGAGAGLGDRPGPTADLLRSGSWSAPGKLWSE
jgi:flagellar motor component MotA